MGDGARTTPARRRVSVTGVLGELLLTAGALVLLFLGWQLWWNDAVLASSQTSSAREQSERWERDGGAEPVPSAPAEGEPEPDYGAPVVAAAPGNGEVVGNLYVPRFGTDYVRTIAEGTGTDVLNSTRLGIGHYPKTQMPGEVGNFAVAAHRSAYGGGMHLINELRVGDPIVVETSDGWYVYRFTNLEYVRPSGVGVLDPVPQQTGAAPTDRIITLTSCNPLYSTSERIIAYGLFDSWQPRPAGPPTELAGLAQAGD